VLKIGRVLSVKEEFHHWVWVAGVDETTEKDGLNQPVDKVDFTYTHSGSSLFDIPVGNDPEDGINYWSSHDGTESTHLPWHVSYSWHDSTMISSTPMVWYWQQYTQYDKNNPRQHPDIFTRYADGSP
jgi:hypothetical protein